MCWWHFVVCCMGIEMMMCISVLMLFLCRSSSYLDENRIMLLTILMFIVKETTSLEGGWCGKSVNSCIPPPNGEFRRCSMCICENLDKFIRHAPTCSANQEIFACYISHNTLEDPAGVGCEVKLKQSWFIGITIACSFVCAACCIYLGFCLYLKRNRIKTHTDISNTEKELDFFNPEKDNGFSRIDENSP